MLSVVPVMVGLYCNTINDEIVGYFGPSDLIGWLGCIQWTDQAKTYPWINGGAATIVSYHSF